MTYLSPFMTLLINAVKKASASLNRDFSEVERLQASVKSYRDFVVSAYTRVEKSLQVELGKINPSYAFAKNGQPKPKGSYFMISPLDGLTNFAHGIAHFSVSVAVFENNAVTAAVVYNPAADELYFAVKGKGAFKEGFRNHERLRVSSRKDLTEALVSATVSYNSEIGGYLRIHDNIVRELDNVRVLGAVSMDLAYVAAGKLDAAVSLGCQSNDIAAGMLLVKEAGGYIYDYRQKDIRSENLNAVLESGNLIAVNASMNTKVVELLQK